MQVKQRKVKSKWLISFNKKHEDYFASLETLIICHDCELIKNIGNWEIELTPDNNLIEEKNYPDWYVFKKIDMK